MRWRGPDTGLYCLCLCLVPPRLPASLPTLPLLRPATAASPPCLPSFPSCSSLYTKKYVITVVASSFGPWLSLVMFACLGNRWHADDCRLVLLSGVALMALPLALMCLFDDDRTLQHPPCAHQEQQQDKRDPLRRWGRGSSSGGGSRPGGTPLGWRWGWRWRRRAAGGLLQHPAPRARRHPADLCIRPDWSTGIRQAAQLVLCHVPCIVSEVGARLLSQAPQFAAADAMCAWLQLPAAAGMTLKFFVIFFMEAVSMGPMAVSLLGALSPLGVSAASLASQPLAKVVGRVQIWRDWDRVRAEAIGWVGGWVGGWAVRRLAAALLG